MFIQTYSIAGRNGKGAGLTPDGLARHNRRAAGGLKTRKQEGDMRRSITLTVNGERRTVAAEPGMPLLYALHDLLGLTGAKYGCGAGQCGSCTVLVAGEKTFSCTATLADVEGRSIEPVEGLADGERQNGRAHV